MKLSEALALIAQGDAPKGFRISFEERQGRSLLGGHFPERGEPPIPTEAEAWAIAELFAARAPQRFVNIYVTTHDFAPVPGYAHRIKRIYPERAL